MSSMLRYAATSSSAVKPISSEAAGTEGLSVMSAPRRGWGRGPRTAARREILGSASLPSNQETYTTKTPMHQHRACCTAMTTWMTEVLLSRCGSVGGAVGQNAILGTREAQ